MAKELMAEIHEDENGIINRSDMTLRDWFAGQALAGLCANSAFDDSFNGNGQGHARFAYKFADAMLEARK